MDLNQIESQMPELFMEFMINLRLSNCEDIREIVVAACPGDSEAAYASVANGTPRFVLCESEFPALASKLSVLTESELMVPITKSDRAAVYRIADAMADYLLADWPQSRWPKRLDFSI